MVWLLLPATPAGGPGGACSVSNARLADCTLWGAAARFDFPRASGDQTGGWSLEPSRLNSSWDSAKTEHTDLKRNSVLYREWLMSSVCQWQRTLVASF